MRNRIIGIAVTTALVIAGCSNSTSDQPAEPDDTQPTETSQPATTLNETDKLEATEKDLTELVTNWYTFPLDTSKPIEEGMPIQYETGDLKTRSEGIVETDTTNLVTRRSVNPNQLEVIGITVDPDGVTAEVSFCGRSDAEIVDNQTDVVIGVDSGLAWKNTLFARLENDEWLLNDFVSGQGLGEENGGEQCELNN